VSPSSPHSYTCTLSLHDALPIYFIDHLVVEPDGHAVSLAGDLHPVPLAGRLGRVLLGWHAGDDAAAVVIGELGAQGLAARVEDRSEEHTSELQSPDQHVCRLLLE